MNPFVRAARDILDRGYAIIPFVPPVDPPEILNPFADLIKLPEEQRQKWCFSFPDDEDPNRPDHGLTRRDDRTSDRKFFFHERPWTASDRDLLTLLEKNGVDLAPYLAWFDQMEMLCDASLDVICRVAHALDHIAPLGLPRGAGFLKELRRREAMQMHVLRLLQYDPKPKAADLADPHYDFGYLTLAGFGESVPGLWLNTPDNLYEAKPGYAVVFAGRKLDKLTDRRIKAVPHGVISLTDKTRQSIIFFSHIYGEKGPSYNDDQKAASTAAA